MKFSARKYHQDEDVNEFKKRKRGQGVEKCLGIRKPAYKLTRWIASCHSEWKLIYTEAKFRLDVRKKFFTLRMVRYCNRLPREAVNAPTLAVLKTNLDKALNNPV